MKGFTQAVQFISHGVSGGTFKTDGETRFAQFGKDQSAKPKQKTGWKKKSNHSRTHTAHTQKYPYPYKFRTTIELYIYFPHASLA